MAIGDYCVPFHVRNTLSLSICSDHGRTGVICILSSEAVCFQLATSEKPVHDYPFLTSYTYTLMFRLLGLSPWLLPHREFGHESIPGFLFFRLH